MKRHVDMSVNELLDYFEETKQKYMNKEKGPYSHLWFRLEQLRTCLRWKMCYKNQSMKIPEMPSISEVNAYRAQIGLKPIRTKGKKA